MFLSVFLFSYLIALAICLISYYYSSSEEDKKILLMIAFIPIINLFIITPVIIEDIIYYIKYKNKIKKFKEQFNIIRLYEYKKGDIINFYYKLKINDIFKYNMKEMYNNQYEDIIDYFNESYFYNKDGKKIYWSDYHIINKSLLDRDIKQSLINEKEECELFMKTLNDIQNEENILSN